MTWNPLISDCLCMQTRQKTVRTCMSISRSRSILLVLCYSCFFPPTNCRNTCTECSSLYRRFLSREKRQFCLLMKYGGSFIRLCWRLPWHLIPLASMLSVWFGVFSKSYQVFLTLEEKTRPSGECEILFEDPLRTSLSNKTKQGASVVTNRIAFFKDESLWFSHEV